MKAAIILAAMTQQEVSALANQHLPATLHLTELHISQIIHNRKVPTKEQAIALAKILKVNESLISKLS
jgi:plasmid maintenance system antidote protein VapI